MDGIIFDVDGTIWDATEVVARTWTHYVKEHTQLNTVITAPMLKSLFGQLLPDISRQLFPSLSQEDQLKLIDILCKKEHEALKKEGAPVYENMEEVLKELSGRFPLFIVSNCQKGYIEAFLDYYQLNEYISDKESFGGTGLPKGENIRLVCERNHLERAVYLGDIEGDYRSACMAGIPFIHAAYGFGTISDPVPAIHSLRELPEAAAEVLDSIRA